MFSKFSFAFGSLLALLISASIGWTNSLEVQELWHGAAVGMTVDEVRALFPGVRPPDRPTKNAYGEDLLLIGKQLQIAGHRRNLEFMFKGGHLVAMDTRVGGDDAPLEISGDEVRKIYREYTKRYGPPTRCARPDENLLTHCFWIVHG